MSVLSLSQIMSWLDNMYRRAGGVISLSPCENWRQEMEYAPKEHAD